MNKRRNFTPEWKAKILIEALRVEKAFTEIAAEYEGISKSAQSLESRVRK